MGVETGAQAVDPIPPAAVTAREGAELTDGALVGLPRERRALLPALQALQRAGGWLSPDALEEAAAHTRVPASEVWGVATHYPELRLAPPPRPHVRVCVGVACDLLGGSRLHAALQSAERVHCLFACGVAPVVEVDGALLGRQFGDLAGRATREDVEREVLAPTARPDAAPARGLRGRRDHPQVLPRPTGAPGAREAPELGAAVDAHARLVAEARAARQSTVRLLVGAGSCGVAVGAGAVSRALAVEAARRGDRIEVIAGACAGACWAAPAVLVAAPEGGAALLERVSARDASALFDWLAGASASPPGPGAVAWGAVPWSGLTPAGAHPFWAPQDRLVTARLGRLDPDSLADALVNGSYVAFARALDRGPDAGAETVLAEVERAGLEGRGGAFFPAAVKWRACRTASGGEIYLVVNGEEGEPGICKDRHLMEGDPHRVLEGALLAALAAGAGHVILYVHGEAALAAARLERAVLAARAAGLLGPSVLGSGVAVDAEVFRGAGGFVLGEETALLESIEGRRAQPRARPPFPVEAGLWGRPTVINNVETLAAVAVICAEGADAWLARGVEGARGTKLFGLSGPLVRPGIVELPGGATLALLLDTVGGGLVGGGAYAGALVGGPSGRIVPPSRFSVPLAPRGPRGHRAEGPVSPGTGGVVGLPGGADVLRIVRSLLVFNAAESCGKCTPCREGLPRLVDWLDALVAGPRGRRAAGQADVARVRELACVIEGASLCGLGQAAPVALLEALDAYPWSFGGLP